MNKRSHTECSQLFLTGKNKRGISSIVATVLIIFGAVVLSTILFFGVKTLMSGLNEINTDVDLQIITSEGYTLWDEENRLATIQVKRGDDNSDLIGFDMVFTFEGDSVKHYVTDIPGTNSKKVYAISFFEFTGSLDSVKIIPVFSDGSLGSVAAELDVTEFYYQDILDLIDEGKLDEEDFVEPSGLSGSGSSSSSSSGSSSSSSSSTTIETTCGDGVIEGNETCDYSGSELLFGSRTCKSEGALAGDLFCNDDCSLDLTECIFNCETCASCDEIYDPCTYYECHSECPTGDCYYRGYSAIRDDCVNLTEACEDELDNCTDYSEEECPGDPCGFGGCHFDEDAGECVSGTCEATCSSLGYSCGIQTICGEIVNCGSCEVSNGCYVKEVCDNGVDDDCDGSTDETDCIALYSKLTNSDDYEEMTYEKWAAGYLIDYVSFGTLHDGDVGDIDDLEGEHDVEACGTKSEYTYFYGSCSASWNFTVPASGYYIWSTFTWNTDERTSTLSYYNGDELVELPELSNKNIDMYLIYFNESGNYRFYNYGNWGNRIFHSQLFALREDPVIENDEPGMRLVVNYDDIEELRYDIQNSWAKVVYSDAVGDANTRANDDPSDYDQCTEGSVMDNRGLKGRVMDITAGYILTGDTKYSDKGIEIIRHVADMNHWVCKAVWSYLSHGEIANALAVGFDTFKDEMNESTRYEIIRNSDRLLNDLYIHSINSEHSGDSSHFWSIQPGNWNAVINGGGLGTAAIAFENDNKYTGDWMEQAVDTQELYFDINFDDEGSYAESLMYINYALANAAMFYQALEEWHGVNFMTYRDNTFLKAAYMHMYFIEPNYRDDSPFDDFSRWSLQYTSTDGRGAVAVNSYWFLAANYFNDHVLGRFVEFMYDFNSEDSLTGAFHDYLGYPSTVTWLFHLDEEASSDVWDDIDNAVLYSNFGRYMTRSAYEDKDAYYLAMQCGYYGSHGQADQGSFIIHALGEVLIDDDGYGTTDSVYHNVILVDGEGQLTGVGDDGYLGSFDSNFHTQTIDYILANSTKGYLLNGVNIDYNLRNMVFVRPSETQDGYYFLADNIDSGETHEYTFNLHHRVDASEWVDLGNNNFKVNSIFFTSENVDLNVFFSSPSNLEATFEEGETNISIVPTTESEEEHFVVLLYPNDDIHVTPSVTKIDNDDFSGFSFNDDLLLYNKDNSLNTYSNVQTDAEIFVGRDSGSGFEFLSMFGGTSLTYDSVNYIEASIPVNVLVEETTSGLNLEFGDTIVVDNVQLIVGGLDASSTYRVYVDGSLSTTKTSSSAGKITFSVSNYQKTILISKN